MLGSESRTGPEALFAEYGREARDLVRGEWAFYLQSYAEQKDAMSAGEPGASWLMQARWSEAMLQDEQAFMNRRLELVDKARQLIRQASDEELIDLLTSAEPLPTALFLSNTLMSSSAGFLERHPEFARLRDLFHDRPALQQRAIDLWWDDRSYASLLFSADELAESAKLLDMHREEFLAPALGSMMFGVVFNAVPDASLLAALDRAIDRSAASPLPEHIEQSIENGVAAAFLGLTPESLAERVERGQLIWLPSLVERDPEGRFAIVEQHMDRLTLAQQLQVIAARPDEGSMEILRAAWYEAMDELACVDCSTPADPIDPMHLVNVLIAMPGQEPADMLVELVELQKTLGENQDHAGILSAMFFSGNEAVLSAALELALDEAVSPLPLMGLERLHSANPEAFQALVEQRLASFHAMSLADRDELLAGPMACHFSSLALYASLSGMDSPWPGWFEKHRATAPKPDDCASEYANVLAIDSLTLPGLDAVLDLYQAGDAAVDSVNSLVSGVRYRRVDDQGRLAERLVVSPIWNELTQENQDWLLGVDAPKASNLSCEGEVPAET
ncbi:hypothetical protein AY599_20120 [Leptolyngbya valderiana BDU 20041]|nr:hypothetical protein AY599_20120 [Leptolyngbya valderiana BDU 20041]